MVNDLADMAIGQLYMTFMRMEAVWEGFDDLLSSSTTAPPYSVAPSVQKLPYHYGQPRLLALTAMDPTGCLILSPFTTRQGKTLDNDNNFRPSDDKAKHRHFLRPASPMPDEGAFQIVAPPSNKHNPPVHYVALITYACKFKKKTFQPVVDADGTFLRIQRSDLLPRKSFEHTVIGWAMNRSRNHCAARPCRAAPTLTTVTMISGRATRLRLQ
ncbi:hypothetical protein HDU87_001486 [Geranomyces variabilis]|uniref:Uncharacterized protein n=1 Tax=Geranomyces variabilis TaxID=109894 RepID=A0AAD5TBK3_9FUNG|nr:hypothetical protein HDU87_001486 [Geranomyces variabilis]